MMSHDMNILKDWFRANQLSLNISKTNLMLFWPKGKMMIVTIDGLTILQVHKTRFLGVILDDELSWTSHINHIRDKLRANKHLMQVGKISSTMTA